MPKLLMLAGGIVKAKQAISAYVVLSAGNQSRVFKVTGTAATPSVSELPAATTLDIKRFERELKEDLQLEAFIEKPPPAEVTGIVRDHLKRTEGIDVEG